jgi:hypothetical protein
MKGIKSSRLRAIVGAAAGAALMAVIGLQNAAAAPVGQTSYWSPALAAFNGKLYFAFVGTDRQLNVMSSADGVNFGAPVVIPNNSSQFGPGLAAFNGRLYLAFVGTDRRHKINYISSADGVTWDNQTTFGNEAGGGSPALAGSSNQLIMAWNGTNSAHNINVACVVCTIYGYGTKYISPIGSGAAVAITSVNDNFFVAFTRDVPANPVVFISSTAANPLGFTQQPDGGNIISGPALGSLNGYLYAGWPTNFPRGPLLFQYYQVNGTTLVGAGGFNTQNASSETNMAIAGFNGHLFYAWLATDSSLNIATLF